MLQSGRRDQPAALRRRLGPQQKRGRAKGRHERPGPDQRRVGSLSCRLTRWPMSLHDYIIRCYTRDCPREAKYKIASRWSDGVTGELKTYSLCCAECLPERFRDSLRKHAACRLPMGETRAPPGISEI